MNTLALGPSWLDPDYLINTFGLPGVLLIVFAESGLLIGFFLPGDSLLFTTGLLVTTGKLDSPLWLVCTLVALAAIIGDQVGYLFGRKVGPALFKRPDSRLFKQENVEKAHEFFEKYGPKSLVLARFVPIVRTFTPIIAGVSRMNYRSFITFNIIGALLWGVGVTVLGAMLGKIDFVHKHIEMILILIVLISVVPIAIELLRARSQSKKSGAAEQREDGAPSDDGPYGGPPAGPYGSGTSAGPYDGPSTAPYGGGPSAGPYGNGPYGDAPSPSPYGDAPSAGSYGAPPAAPYRDAPSPGPYGAPPAGPYNAPPAGTYNAPSAGPYNAPSAGPYGAPPARGPYNAPSEDPYGDPHPGRDGGHSGPPAGPDDGPDGGSGRGRHARR